MRDSGPFRAAFAARAVSLIGIGLLVVTVPAQTYALSGSSLHVAAVSVVTAAGVFLGALAGGVLADRCERRRTISWARAVAGLCFAALGVNALLPHPSLLVVYLASAVDGAAGGVSSAALMAVSSTLVRRDQLAAAGALIVLTTDVGTVAGPALAGVLLAAGGPAATYFTAAGATAATVLLLRGLGPCPPPPRRDPSGALSAVADGIRFAVRHRLVRGVLVVGTLAMVLAGPLVLLPAYVEQVLGAGPRTLGLLYAAPAIGAVLASLTSGWTARASGGVAVLAVAVMASGPLGVGLAGTTVVAVLALAVHGAARAVGDVVRFALLQAGTPDAVRGRVSGLWQVQALAGTAVGSGLAGLLGRWFDPATALVVHGTVGLVAAAVVAVCLRRTWRPPDGRTVPAGRMTTTGGEAR